MFGQADGDERGIITGEAAAQIRRMRVAEIWNRFDSIVIGPGAADRSRGWYNSWVDFSAADTLEWFSGRSSNAGKAYTNQNTERTDWAQDLFQTSCEFIAPPGQSELETDVNDGQNTPLMFTQQLPNLLSLRVILAESDEIASAPASHFPAGTGTSYPVISGSAAPGVIGGNNGEPHVSNAWKWPEPVMLAAKAKITVRGSIDAPLRQFLASLPGPGYKEVPDGSGGVISIPNWYIIRISHLGPRYLQIRGARSSA